VFVFFYWRIGVVLLDFLVFGVLGVDIIPRLENNYDLAIIGLMELGKQWSTK